MLSQDSEDEMWSRFVFELVIWPQKLLWQDELNPRVRCAFGNVFFFPFMLSSSGLPSVKKASWCPGTVFSDFCLAGWGQRPVNISFWVWLCYIMCHTFCILRSVLSLLYFPLQCARHGRTACWELDGKEFAWEATLSKIVLFNININMNFEININISTNKL